MLLPLYGADLTSQRYTYPLVDSLAIHKVELGEKVLVPGLGRFAPPRGCDLGERWLEVTVSRQLGYHYVSDLMG